MILLSISRLSIKITSPAAIRPQISQFQYTMYIIRLDVDETHAMIVNPWAPKCFGIKKALINCNVIFTSIRIWGSHQRWPVDSLVCRGTRDEASLWSGKSILIEWRVTASQLKACLPISSNTRGLAMATSKEIDKWKRLIGGRDRQVNLMSSFATWNWFNLCTAPYPPPSELGKFLLLCEKSLEVQPTVDKEPVFGGPVLQVKDSGVARCFTFVTMPGWLSNINYTLFSLWSWIPRWLCLPYDNCHDSRDNDYEERI